MACPFNGVPIPLPSSPSNGAMNPITTTSAPDWLKNAYSSAHILLALKTLAQRESVRLRARAASVTREGKPEHARRALYKLLHPSAVAMISHYSVATGSQPDHAFRNRYRDIIPYDRTRVVLQAKEDTGENDSHGYLNANWVLERFGGKWWIASQAPLPNTSHTFLSLFSEPLRLPASGSVTRVRTVVQLTQNTEGGRTKAHPYFPETVGQSVIIAPEEGIQGFPLKVTLLKKERVDEACCFKSTVAFVPISSSASSSSDAKKNQEKTVTFQHLLYYAWPDYGVPAPEDRQGLLSFIRLVDSTNRDVSLVSDANGSPVDPDPPIVVGCSAGIGRTGSFIALTSLLRAHGLLPPASSPTSSSVLPESPLDPLPAELQADQVVQEIDSLREQRPGMVQRPEQVQLIYDILEAAFQIPR